MQAIEKVLVKTETQLEFYKKLYKKIEQVLDAKLELDDWHTEVYSKIHTLESELEKIEEEIAFGEYND